MIVVDASVVLHILADGATDPDLIEVMRQAETLAAPHLLDLEIINALRKQRLSNRASAIRTEQALADFNALPIERQPTHHLNARIWQLCQNLTAYDAAYVALAENLDVPLLTRDKRMAHAPHNAAQIILV